MTIDEENARVGCRVTGREMSCPKCIEEGHGLVSYMESFQCFDGKDGSEMRIIGCNRRHYLTYKVNGVPE